MMEVMKAADNTGDNPQRIMSKGVSVREGIDPLKKEKNKNHSMN